MIQAEHKDLWKRIEAFSIDDPGAAVSFSYKLARENNWSKDYTDRVITEYKKFIFLCCVLPGGASPSDPVDQAWHMHLTYTVNYWKEFCGKTLGKEIHHHPSKGGVAEKKKHTNWYAHTLEQYRYFFESDPPGDIWPLVPAPEPIGLEDAEGRWSDLRYLLFFIPAFFIPFFFGEANPFHLTGPQFLLFFAGLITGLVFALTFRYFERRKIFMQVMDGFDMNKFNVFQLTRFVYGADRSLQTAIVDLADRGLLIPEKKGKFIINTKGYHAPDVEEVNPLLPALFHYYTDGDIATISGLQTILNTDRTFTPDLALLYVEVRKKDQLSIAMLIFVLLLGGMRILQGLSNDQPVSYLFMIVVVLGIAGAMALSSISCASMFRSKVKDKYQAGEWKMRSTSTSAPALDFAFLGVVALSGIYANDNLQQAFRDHRWDSSSSPGSGCGSSGCGSSGCGGGGCGGCGGG